MVKFPSDFFTSSSFCSNEKCAALSSTDDIFTFDGSYWLQVLFLSSLLFSVTLHPSIFFSSSLPLLLFTFLYSLFHTFSSLLFSSLLSSSLCLSLPFCNMVLRLPFPPPMDLLPFLPSSDGSFVGIDQL